MSPYPPVKGLLPSRGRSLPLTSRRRAVDDGGWGRSPRRSASSAVLCMSLEDLVRGLPRPLLRPPAPAGLLVDRPALGDDSFRLRARDRVAVGITHDVGRL